MRFIYFALFLALASCASKNSATKGVTFQEFNAQVEKKFAKNLKCAEFSRYKFVTKLDLVVCLSELSSGQRQSVRLNYKDLPKSGPIVDQVFYLISIGAARPKSAFEFGSQDFVQEKEITTALKAIQ